MFREVRKVSDELPSGLRAFQISYARTVSRECGGFASLVICKVSLARERCPFKSIVSRGPLADTLLATLVLPFGFQGEQIIQQPVVRAG
jgi:hypothetical protein